jgi:hypothetical protein
MFAQGKSRKQRVVTQVTINLIALEVRKIATTTTRNTDLFSQSRGMIDQDDPGAAPARLSGTVHSCSASTDNRYIKRTRTLDRSSHLADAPDEIDIDVRAAFATART